jgi:hypothetical protein
VLPPRLRQDSEPDLTALDQFSDAAAHSTLTTAQTTSSVNGTDTGSGSTTSSGESKGHFKVR